MVSRARARPQDGEERTTARSRPEERLGQAVSVRFTESELRRIQAYAVVLDLSPNAVIRQACEYFLSHKVATKEYEEALTAYRKRSEERVAALEEMRSA